MQIANFKVENSVKSLKITTFWDPSEPQATRPVSLTLAPNAQISGRLWSLTPETYYYSHDYTKNICELFSVDEQNNVNIVRSYDYSPFGAVTEHVIDSAIVNLENNFRFSSEFYDSELALCYYNYRHYNPLDGRWLNRDPMEEYGGLNLYGFAANNIVTNWDYLGLYDYGFTGGLLSGYDEMHNESNNQTAEAVEKNNRMMLLALKRTGLSTQFALTRAASELAETKMQADYLALNVCLAAKQNDHCTDCSEEESTYSDSKAVYDGHVRKMNELLAKIAQITIEMAEINGSY